MEGARVDGELGGVSLCEAGAGAEASDEGVVASSSSPSSSPMSLASSRTSSVSAGFASIETWATISEPSASVSATVPRSRRSAGTSGTSAASSTCSGRIPRTTTRPSYALQLRTRGERLVREREPLVADLDGEATVRLGERAFEHVHGRAADEAADEEVDGPVVQLLRPSDLLELALPHDGDPVAHRHGLDLVVRHVDGRRSQIALETADLGAHLDAELRVQVRERLVHEEGLRIAHDRAPHRDALALAARERARLALEERLEPEDVGCLVHAPVDLVLLLALEPEAESDVVVDAQVRIERVALEDHRDVAVLRRDVVDDALADPDHALGDVLEAGHHAKSGRLAAAGRADEDHELPVLDLDLQVGDGPGSVRVHLAHTVEADCGQSEPLLPGS